MRAKNETQQQDTLGLGWRDSPEGPLARIVQSHLQARGRNLAAEPPPRHRLWAPEFFGLHEVRLFQRATESQQREILDGCCRLLLNEAYFIEKSGLAYCAQMILLASAVDVRQVYALISSDEAAHLQWVRPYVEEQDRMEPVGALLRFLNELIAVCDQNTLAFLVQVMLEGWGLHHYKALAESCRDPGLQQVFRSIHRDEVLHHHTGEVVFNPQLLGARETALVRDSLRFYAELVRAGPQAVVSAIDCVLGGLDLHDKTQVFTELRTEQVSAGKLEILRSLMNGPGREGYVAELTEAGAFIPYGPAACARLHDADARPTRCGEAAAGV
ncbi:MAG TPA: ferritin-like domain-containing protein [Verrucomicrobiales bacterium]|nr:ferritin-like domain-containing protein [Verrucomicrobiales bacterium]